MATNSNPEGDWTTLSTETWEAFLQALAYAIVLNNTRPANSAEFLLRAALYTETHPLGDSHKQDTVRATHAKFAEFVDQALE